MEKDIMRLKKNTNNKNKREYLPYLFSQLCVSVCVCACTRTGDPYENKMRGSINYKALDKYEGFLAEIQQHEQQFGDYSWS